MSAMSGTPLTVAGAYDLGLSLRTAGRAAFVAEPPGIPDGTLDLAFLIEGTWAPVGVHIRQELSGPVIAEVLANPDGTHIHSIVEQVSRILSLDIDGEGIDRVTRVPELRDLTARFRGLRPVQFPSPYEAAARAIIGHRLPVRQAASITTRVAEEYGTVLQVGERALAVFPAPDRLATIGFVRGLSARKVEQLQALGRAAGSGRFTAARLRNLDRAEAIRELQTLPGIGPFSAELIMIRGAGDPDAFPRTEPKLHRAMAARFDVTEDDLDGLERVAATWQPYRSWVGLMLREA